MPINKKCLWMFTDIWVKTVCFHCCPLIVYLRFWPRLIERLSSTQIPINKKCVWMFADIWVKNCLYSMLPPHGMPPVKASTHRKIKLNPFSPSTKKVCECLQIFGWKTVSIQCCPLMVCPRLRPRLIETLSWTQKAHQEKMCVNVCWYLGEKMPLLNVASLLYIPGWELDS